MRYLSVCSGIEAATVAWKPLGWHAVGFSEIEKFPCALLRHYYPEVPNYGDLTKYEKWGIERGTIDVLIGGTPCQDFSVAGNRAGLDGDRSSLARSYIGLIEKIQPTWFIWENVPGCLSTNGGQDFGAIIGAMVKCGYGVAYRICDAQYWGIAQRRRRVFVVGHFGDWRPATTVLFDSKGGGWDTPTAEKEGANNSTINGNCTYQTRYEISSVDSQSNLVTSGIANTLIAEGNIPIVCVSHRQANAEIFTEKSPTLTRQSNPVWVVNDECRQLTPKEYERLQGFPDDYTLIPYPKKLSADAPRYKALGNSMAVPVIRWLGERIDMIALLKREAKQND